MKLRLLLFSLILLLNTGNAFSQGGLWTWMSGDSAINSPGTFGTQEVPASSNTPPALYESVFWHDNNGCLWLFGGDNQSGYYSDLWNFNPYSNQWTWVKGTGLVGQSGSYGSIGVPSASNIPGARCNGVARWVDTSGNLWLYGGLYMGRYNDLWKYDMSIGMWVWMGGTDLLDQEPVYGVQGVPSAANNPGGRYEVICNWMENNNLWLFGGFNGDFLNDLWKYDIATGEWTWMNGANFNGQVSHYGIMGVPDTANHPGARCAVANWADSSGNFWLFGGNGLDTSGVQHCFNDMWKYDISSATWTWMGGPNTGSQPGNYGTMCSQDSFIFPSSRYEHHSCFTDKCNNFWLFGGATYQNPDLMYGQNDLWKFLPSSNEWIWVSGDSTVNVASNFGVKGVPSAANIPAGRMGSAGFIDSLNNIWVFGGDNFEERWYDFNDLWKYVADTTCAGPFNCGAACQQAAVTITSNRLVLCPGDSTTICAPPGYETYIWSTGDTTTCITTMLAGNYYVKIANSIGCSDTSNHLAIVVLSPPPVVINIFGDTLRAFNALTYQWYYNNALLLGDTDSILVASRPGMYSVAVSDSNGCSIMSNNEIISGINSLADEMSLKVYPDPATDELNISYQLNSPAKLQIAITDITGRRIATVLNEEELNGNYLQHINIRNLASAVYILTFTTESGSVNLRFVKQ